MLSQVQLSQRHKIDTILIYITKYKYPAWKTVNINYATAQNMYFVFIVQVTFCGCSFYYCFSFPLSCCLF